MSLVYFTSDLHLGHPLAARERDFMSVELHDAVVINSFAHLKKRDILYVLGDVCMGRVNHLDLIRDIPAGRKILLLGNHDQFRAVEYLSVFDDIIGPVTWKHMWLTHIPMHPQEMFNRVGNIHGHIHKGGATPELENPPYFNVNWDFHRGPVLYEAIRDALAKEA
jgi:calcineurin-like phosphoesterase family protein